MAKSANKDGVRQRKKNENGEGDVKAAPKTTSKPQQQQSSGGMTCLNWFVVLFFIIAASGGASFFVYNEMTLTNRALLKELNQLRSESSAVGEFKGQIKVIMLKLETMEQLQEEITNLNNKEASRGSTVDHLTLQIKNSQTGFADLASQVEDSSSKIESLEVEMEALKSMKSTQSESAELKKLDDLIKVSNTNIAYLSDEAIRLDKRLRDYFEQTNSIQKEVIDLTADKLAMGSAIESIKTTVVNIRENLEKLESQGPVSTQEGETTTIEATLKELDTRTTAEIAKLSRQVSETSENSAQWLQQSTDQISKKCQQTVEDLTKQFNEVKVQIKEPAQATENESLINSVATLDTKISGISQTVTKLNKTLAGVVKYQKSKQQADADEVESVEKLTYRVIEIMNEAAVTEDKLEELTKQVTKINNELNGVKTTARILESRVDEVRTGTKDPIPQPAEPEGRKE
uniref:myosin-J heavy chain-like n=1 Tax=Styela clava TaxID=7725 RepID=UPI0019393EB1|nr:myosin-J heavy chain-like [Styela clava]